MALPAPETILFDDMVEDMSAHLPGCPSPTIAKTIKKIIVDLCQRGKVWEADLEPINILAGDAGYALESPVAYGECTDVVQAFAVVDGKRTPVTWCQTVAGIRAHYPGWPDESEGTPTHATSAGPGLVLFAPTPDAAGTIELRGKLRPTKDATEWDAALYNEFARAIFHGVLYELMLMPNRGWSDAKLAIAHGKHWTHLLAAARYRAESGYNIGSLAADPRPLA